MDERELIAEYRMQLKRVAWRLQYRTRSQRKREIPFLFPERAINQGSEQFSCLPRGSFCIGGLIGCCK